MTDKLNLKNCFENVNQYTQSVIYPIHFYNILTMKRIECLNTLSLGMNLGFLTKKWLGLKWFKNYTELNNNIINWFKIQVVNFTTME